MEGPCWEQVLSVESRNFPQNRIMTWRYQTCSFVWSNNGCLRWRCSVLCNSAVSKTRDMSKLSFPRVIFSKETPEFDADEVLHGSFCALPLQHGQWHKFLFWVYSRQKHGVDLRMLYKIWPFHPDYMKAFDRAHDSAHGFIQSGPVKISLRSRTTRDNAHR